MVKYQGKWINAKQKFELEQKAKGLVKYQGKWINAKQKFELEQKAKGLVFYKSKWVSPKQKFELKQQAKGFIKYQGKWISGAEKLRIEEKLRKQIPALLKKYYAYLRRNCKKSISNNSIVAAYQKLESRTQSIEKFLSFSPSFASLVLTKLRQAQKKSQRFCSIYPASLYDHLDEFSFVLNNSKLSKLKNDISRLEIKFDRVITEKRQQGKKLEMVSQKILTKQRAIDNLKKQIELPAQLRKEISQIDLKIEKIRAGIEDFKEEKTKASKEINSLQFKIERHQKKQQKLEKDNSFEIRNIKSKIDDREEELDKQQKNTKEIIQDINRTQRKLDATTDKEQRARLRSKLSTLRRERNTSQSLERSLKRDVVDFESDIKRISRELEDSEDEEKSLLSELSDLEHQQKENENKIEHLQNESTRIQEQKNSKQNLLSSILEQLSDLKTSLKQAQEKIIFLNTERVQIGNDIIKSKQTLAPLTKLYQKRKKIHNVTKTYQNWWTNLHKNKGALEKGREKIVHPRKNLLLALFILQNFPRDYFKVKIEKGYRHLGIVYVYYW